MHIVFCHNAIVPPLKYGGTERVIYWLAKALNALGHRTTLIAKRGSFIPGTTVIPIEIDEHWEKQIPSDGDILHLWTTPRSSPPLPFVVTIEGNGQESETFHPNTIFISRKHAENHGAQHFVYNGIDLDDYEAHPTREDYLVFLAKASWSVKNLEGAIKVARAAKMPLEVLGSRDWPLGLHKWRPRGLGGIRYHGMVGDEAKKKILSRARALVFPVRWHEPFGIAITEALASGCAILGTPYGSLPEIVTAETGTLSADGRKLAEALRENRRFSPAACRARILDGFSHFDMAKAYLAYYESVLRTGHLGPQPLNAPRTIDGVKGLSSKSLLPWAFSAVL